MNLRTTIIDADSLLYQSSKETLEESISIIDEKIESILAQTKAQQYALFISIAPYFRHDISPDYKSKRVSSQLLWLKTLKSYLIENYNAKYIKGIEADDICSIILNDSSSFLLDRDYITMCSPDKDLVKANYGRHLDYKYIIKDNILIKGTWVETSEDEAIRFFWTQMLTGDTVDGILGLRGVGKVGANKLIADIPTEMLPETIFKAYISALGESIGISEYYKNYRLLKMLKTTKEYEELFEKNFPEIIFTQRG